MIAVAAAATAITALLAIIFLLKSGARRSIIPFTAALLVGALASLFVAGTGYSIYGSAAFIFSAVMSAFFFVMTLYYTRGIRAFMLLAAMAVMQLLIGVAYGPSLPYMRLMAVSFGIGTGIGFFLMELHSGSNNVRSNKGIETSRDIFQIIIGLVVVFLLLYFKRTYIAEYVILAMILIGYSFNALSNSSRKRSGLESFFWRLERAGAVYGTGATYAAAGIGILLGLVPNVGMLTIGCAALFFGDSIATIVGKSFNSPPLPYNKSKSLYGFVAFFLVTSVIGFPLIGIYSFPLGLILAVVESIGTKIDDNLSIPIATAVVYLLLSVV